MTDHPEASGQDRGEDGVGQNAIHTPVLLDETLHALALAPSMVVVDGTVGNAGHASAMAQRIGASGRLLGLDRDPEILARARTALESVRDPDGARVGFSLFHLRFSQMREALDREGLGSCDRVFLDLGVSSLQLDDRSRGFSFMADTPLDMRMDPTTGVTAAQWLERSPEEDISKVLFELGDERYSRRIARALCARPMPIVTTGQLAQAVVEALPPRARHGRIHPATRTFQALRMVVNEELPELRAGLEAARACLAPGGRLVVISFHSGEDRIVKRFVRAHLQVLTKKPVRATAEEVRRNPRARSARLRAAAVEDAA